MKTLEQLTKKQLIKLITEIRPKADAYDRVCQELGIKNNIIGEFKKLNIPPVIKSVCDHEWINHSFDHFGLLQEQICDKCGAKQSVP